MRLYADTHTHTHDATYDDTPINKSTVRISPSDTHTPLSVVLLTNGGRIREKKQQFIISCEEERKKKNLCSAAVVCFPFFCVFSLLNLHPPPHCRFIPIRCSLPDWARRTLRKGVLSFTVHAHAHTDTHTRGAHNTERAKDYFGKYRNCFIFSATVFFCLLLSVSCHATLAEDESGLTTVLSPGFGFYISLYVLVLRFLPSVFAILSFLSVCTPPLIQCHFMDSTPLLAAHTHTHLTHVAACFSLPLTALTPFLLSLCAFRVCHTPKRGGCDVSRQRKRFYNPRTFIFGQPLCYPACEQRETKQKQYMWRETLFLVLPTCQVVLCFYEMCVYICVCSSPVDAATVVWFTQTSLPPHSLSAFDLYLVCCKNTGSGGGEVGERNSIAAAVGCGVASHVTRAPPQAHAAIEESLYKYPKSNTDDGCIHVWHPFFRQHTERSFSVHLLCCCSFFFFLPEGSTR